MKFLKLLAICGLFLVTGYGCKRNGPSELSENDLRNISKIENDSIYLDENGNKVIVKFNSRIEDVPNSINGKVKYSFDIDDNGDPTFDKFGKVSKIVYKDDYRNDTYSIDISNDTLFIGETFSASIWTKYRRYLIEIQEPEKITIESKDIQDYYQYEFVLPEEGVYSFKGTIFADSISVPFEYKFFAKRVESK